MAAANIHAQQQRTAFFIMLSSGPWRDMEPGLFKIENILRVECCPAPLFFAMRGFLPV
jgi:hypothetical protein